MPDMSNDVQLLHDAAAPAAPRQVWHRPGWRILKVKRSLGGPDVASDGHGFVS